MSLLSSHSDDLIEYLEIDIELISSRETEQETVLALLAAFGFYGFREEKGRILAYMESAAFSQADFDSFLDQYRLKEKIKTFKSNSIQEQNWNKLWEEDYSPVLITGDCYIRAPFHPPPEGVKFDIIISPKMSFGTAHHETTRLMLETILSHEWDRNRVLDAGTGTGILAILAEKMGADEIVALDNDRWAWENAGENIGLNNCSKISLLHAELRELDADPFGTIFANINLNILLQEMNLVASCLVRGGIAIMSGFYLRDLEFLNNSASEVGLTLITKETLNNWTVGVYRKAH